MSDSTTSLRPVLSTMMATCLGPSNAMPELDGGSSRHFRLNAPWESWKVSSILSLQTRTVRCNDTVQGMTYEIRMNVSVSDSGAGDETAEARIVCAAMGILAKIDDALGEDDTCFTEFMSKMQDLSRASN